MLRFALALFVFSSLSLTAWSKRTSLNYLGREFVLVTPDGATKAKIPLLVMLHGCKQNPAMFLDGTQMEQEALRNGFAILLPDQPKIANFDNCWNWFLDIQQMRNPLTEMGQIMSTIDLVIQKSSIDRDRIFLTGISAGGVMAHSLMACYPDYFAGVAIHSGLAFKTAESINEAQTVLTSTSQKNPEYLGQKAYECGRGANVRRVSRVLMIHGENDGRVPVLHLDLLMNTQEVWRDYMDDGHRNKSSRPSIKEGVIDFPNNYRAHVVERTFPGQKYVDRSYLIQGLGHAWGGGKPISINFDPKAPSSNKIILEFFKLQR